MIILIAVSVIFGVYLVISTVTSILAYSTIDEVVNAYKSLKPEEYAKTRLNDLWRLPRWYRIKECIKIGSVPIAHILALSTILTQRVSLENELIALYRSDLREECDNEAEKEYQAKEI